MTDKPITLDEAMERQRERVRLFANAPLSENADFYFGGQQEAERALALLSRIQLPDPHCPCCSCHCSACDS